MSSFKIFEIRGVGHQWYKSLFFDHIEEVLISEGQNCRPTMYKSEPPHLWAYGRPRGWGFCLKWLGNQANTGSAVILLIQGASHLLVTAVGRADLALDCVQHAHVNLWVFIFHFLYCSYCIESVVLWSSVSGKFRRQINRYLIWETSTWYFTCICFKASNDITFS